MLVDIFIVNVFHFLKFYNQIFVSLDLLDVVLKLLICNSGPFKSADKIIIGGHLGTQFLYVLLERMEIKGAGENRY